jgi:hypothetical protein
LHCAGGNGELEGNCDLMVRAAEVEDTQISVAIADS